MTRAGIAQSVVCFNWATGSKPGVPLQVWLDSFSPHSSDRLCGPPSLLSDGYRFHSLRAERLVLNLRIYVTVPPLPYTSAWRDA